jgi:Flp pilus assembly protein protease CpaA
MFGLEYLSIGYYNVLVVILAFVVMLVGSITDLQKREVADWINYGLFFAAIALRLLYFTITLNPYVLLDGFFGFLIFAAVGFTMFYTGQWGGGDTKMIIGLGILFGLKVIPFDLYSIMNSLLVSFLVNSLILGSVYGLVWSIFLVIKNRKSFISSWKRVSKELRVPKLMFISTGCLLFAFAFIFPSFSILLVPLGLVSILMMYSLIYTKSIEGGCMVSMLPPEKITEGDWIFKDIFVKGKRIAGPKDLGISKEQIALLKKLKVKKVAVKIGIPFVPSFLLGFIATFLIGNSLTFLLQIML